MSGHAQRLSLDDAERVEVGSLASSEVRQWTLLVGMATARTALRPIVRTVAAVAYLAIAIVLATRHGASFARTVAAAVRTRQP